jgi:hypothetical protein
VADSTANAIRDTLMSPNVSDSNGESANIVDAVASLSYSTKRIANAITPGHAAGSTDASGGHVESLTEAVMGMTAGLGHIAEAIESLADAVRNHGGGE